MNPTIKALLDQCPDPGPVGYGLAGWQSGQEFVCGECAGRLVLRGLAHPLRGWTVVWGPKRTCEYCGPVGGTRGTRDLSEAPETHEEGPDAVPAAGV